MLRVIAGKYRRSQLEVPPGDTTRPITDRVKESIFNILGSRFGTPGELPEIEVLDVFAGSGAFGIEALSRGARRCTFVERNRLTAKTLKSNLERLKPAPEVAILIENAWTMRPPDREFGLMFVDPPYRDVANTLQVVDLLDRLSGRLAADGIVLFRYEFRTEFDASLLNALELTDVRRIGRMRLLFLQRRGSAAAAGPDALA